MGAVVFVKYEYWKDVSAFSLDNIVQQTTVVAIFIYCTIVLTIQEKFNTQISNHLSTIIGNIRFLSGILPLVLLLDKGDNHCTSTIL